MKKTLEQIDLEFIQACDIELDLLTTMNDGNRLAEKFKSHRNHNVIITTYGKQEEDEFETWNVAVECEDCCEILIDSDVCENASDTSVDIQQYSREVFLDGEEHNQ